MKDKEYLYDLNDLIEEEAREMTRRLKKREVPLAEKSAEYVDKITHILKSLSCIIAMDEEKDEGASERMSGRMVNTTDGVNSYRGSYRGGSYDGGASGRRGRNAMGRFTSRSNGSYDNGYSEAADEMIGLLEEAKSCAEDEQMKQELQKLIRKAHSM